MEISTVGTDTPRMHAFLHNGMIVMRQPPKYVIPGEDIAIAYTGTPQQPVFHHLPRYMGNTFTRLCSMYLIVNEIVLYHFTQDTVVRDTVTVAFTERVYRKLLDWAAEKGALIEHWDRDEPHQSMLQYVHTFPRPPLPKPPQNNLTHLPSKQHPLPQLHPRRLPPPPRHAHPTPHLPHPPLHPRRSLPRQRPPNPPAAPPLPPRPPGRGHHVRFLVPAPHAQLQCRAHYAGGQRKSAVLSDERVACA